MREQESKQGQTDILVACIPRKWLPLYEQAAADTDYQVKVIGREGYRYYYIAIDDRTNEQINKSRILAKDEVAVSVRPPDTERDHSPFGQVFDRLRREFETQEKSSK